MGHCGVWTTTTTTTSHLIEKINSKNITNIYQVGWDVPFRIYITFAFTSTTISTSTSVIFGQRNNNISILIVNNIF